MGTHRNFFLSTVSAEFRSYRDFLRAKLARPNVSVMVQEDFIAGGRPTLDKLDDYIAHCDAVIHFVGDRTGASPAPAAVESLRRLHPELTDRLPFLATLPPAELAALTYTQWEAYIAIYHRKTLLIAKPNSAAPRDMPGPVDAAQRQRQTDHLARLQELGHYAEISFDDAKDIAIGVLRNLASILPPEGTIIDLPFPTLGSLFIGRDEEMKRLKEALYKASKESKATAIVGHVVHGLGGIGKTRLAVEYAHCHAAEYEAVLFLSGDTPQQLQASIAQLTGPLVLNLPEQSAREQDVQVAAALRWLGEHKNWFLIVDNLDTPEAIAAAESMLARVHGGAVLFTSRLTTFSDAVVPLELDVLDEKDAARLLLEKTGPTRRRTATDDADAATLAHELGGLALALEQAGTFVKVKRISLGDYLIRWRNHLPAVTAYHHANLMKYPKSVAVTYETTLEQLTAGDVALLRLLAHMGPEPVPMFVVEGTEAEAVWKEAVALLVLESQISNPNSSTSPPLSGDLEESRANLANFSMARLLADPNGDAMSVHRVVQDLIRQRIPETRRTAWATLGLWLLAAAIPEDSPTDVRTWPRWTPMAVHVEFAAEYADDLTVTYPTAILYAKLAQFLDGKALYPAAESRYRRALAMDEKRLPPDHPTLAIHLNNLGMLLQTTNRLLDAEPLMRRALSIDESFYGTDHPRVAIDINNLAQLLKARNRLPDAEPLMRRALSIGEASYGAHHPSVAIRLNNLAALLQITNRLVEAEPLMRRALLIDEASYGKDHPLVATRLNNLAQLLQDTNRLPEAEPLMRRALLIDETSYTRDHPNVAIRLNNLAQLLQATNRLPEAEPLMRRALLIDETSYGKDHPRVAIHLGNLASLLQATNRLPEAEPLMRRALLIDESSYGEDHPKVATRLNNLASLLQATSRLPEAEPLMRRALSINQASYGKDHPRVAINLNNLASLLCATNRLPEAEPLMRRALLIDEASYGKDHPSVARDLSNLAHLLKATNRLPEAEPHMRRALHILFTSLGAEHPNTRAVRANYELILRDLGLTEDAIAAKVMAAQGDGGGG